MRILLVSIYDVARSGGLSSHVAELLEGLRDRGHDVSVATPHTECQPLTRRLVLDAPRIPMRWFGTERAYLHFLAWSRKLLRRGIRARLGGADIGAIHAQDPVAALAALDAVSATAEVAGRPRIVLTVHGDIANMAVSDGAIRPGGRAQQAVERLEAEIGKPVTSSNHALAWHCLRLANYKDAVPGFGRLYTV